MAPMRLADRLRNHADWLRHEEMDTATIEEAIAALDRTEALEQALRFIREHSGDPVMERAADAALSGGDPQ
jgi:hypothetical protein